MITPKQAAERVGVSVSLVYQRCKAGLFTCLRLGAAGKRGRLMIDPVSFQAFLDSCTQQPKVNVPLRHIKL